MPERAVGQRAHAGCKGHVQSVRGSVGPPPEHPPGGIRQPAAALHDVAVRGAVESDRAFPVAAHLARGGVAGHVVGRAKRSGGKALGLIEVGALVVRAHGVREIRDAYLVVGLRRHGVRTIPKVLAVRGRQAERRREPLVDAPDAAPRIVLMCVLAVRIDRREIKVSVCWLPPPLGLRDVEGGLRCEEGCVVAHVEITNHEGVRDDADAVVGNALRRPDGSRARVVG
mmetsp:Transcript_38022/g.100481  ORF Transcript_38022/g.100481 Transcript_38022/m.100481 type:complete len:227 (-) Transcript_38022:39-719(-)